MVYPEKGIWAVGTLGKITFHSIISSVEKINSEVPENLVLFQNYPNPFNQSTIIVFQCPYTSYVQSKIYDITGKVIAILVNEKLQGGTYEVKYTADNLKSGAYFYQLTTEKFSDTKRLIIVK